jgi:hypothetical protein
VALRVPVAVRLELTAEAGRIVGRQRHAADEAAWAGGAALLSPAAGARGSWRPRVADREDGDAA